MSQDEDQPAHYYLAGGGIASLAAAVFLIRDAGVSGEQVTIFEKEDRFGGSLDGAGDAERGYLVRGGRMFEPNFVCTFDLLNSIPCGLPGGLSAKEDIFAFNRDVPGSSRCRLIRDGAKADTRLGLRLRDMRDLARLTQADEAALDGKAIDECFDPAFFRSNFWIMWSTMFAFQTWHSAIELARYLKRFIHLFPGFTRMEGVLRTRFNQYDSLIAPILDWLTERGVKFETEAAVIDATVSEAGDTSCISALLLERGGQSEIMPVSEKDRVFFTLGSMTANSVQGSNTAPPPPPETDSAWTLWKTLAAKSPIFGRPDVFCPDVTRTRWESFTVTLKTPAFVDHMEHFSGNRTGTGGLVSIADSGWMLCFVMFHQPHFHQQADGTYVFWGYGLLGDREGDYVKKPMAACTGEEILEELAGQLHLGDEADAMFRDAIVRPCMMPLITSQFMPRRAGDRPEVVPAGARNFACLGQYCEQKHDVVFTVEYSVRSAMTAVHRLAGGKPPPPVKRTDRNPIVIANALRTILAG
ncbi:oleate hydratase [Hyphomonas jannaschiana]|uniref:Myosin-cross-reactive antigen n=1 Tax=Hyphomonas jannaschiana VP2 TaxID=1280952 RepID=A0A059F668_9PROT|nr:oleate hydratase [Hyphomonas jannaschiana]KCZ82647.1 myosin-cross-reactive antigen [Hyphomonas jannaschiana VP2]